MADARLVDPLDSAIGGDVFAPPAPPPNRVFERVWDEATLGWRLENRAGEEERKKLKRHLLATIHCYRLATLK